jgi:hypothetical protein
MRTRATHGTRLASFIAALALSVWAKGAVADPSPLVLGQATPAALSPPSGDPASTEEASVRFKRGLQLFDEGDYTLALVEFERAYQLAPNYRALYNIGLVDVQLGRYADAARTFEQYLRDGGDGIPASRKAEVTNTLAELKVRTATVDLSINAPNAEVTLDGKPLDASRYREPMLIDAGEHTLKATAPGFQAASRTITLAGTDRLPVRLSLVPIAAPQEAPPERGRSLFWPGLVATGAFAAGAAVSGIVMLEARSRLSDLKSTPCLSGCTPTLLSAQLTSDANQNNSAAIAADVLSGLAVVSAGVSLYLSLHVDHSPKAPSVGIGPGRITLSGTF